MDILLLLLVCLLTCSGQMLQKQAVVSWQHQPCNHWQKLRSPWLIASVAALGCGMLLWIYLLQRLPLSMAYPCSASIWCWCWWVPGCSFTSRSATTTGWEWGPS